MEEGIQRFGLRRIGQKGISERKGDIEEGYCEV